MGKRRQRSGAWKRKKEGLGIAGEPLLTGYKQTDTQIKISGVSVWFVVSLSCALVFTGFLLDFARIWQTEYRTEFTLFIFLISAGMSLVVCLGEKIPFLSAVASLLLIVTGIFNHVRLFQGARNFLNAVIESWNYYFDTHYSGYYVGKSELSYFLLYTLVWFIFLFVRSAFRASGRICILTPCAAIVCLGLLVGKGPDGEAFFLMLAGTLPALSFAGGLRCVGGIRHRLRLAKNGLFAVAALAAGMALYAIAGEKLSAAMKENHDSLLAYQRNLERQIIAFADEFEGGFSVFGGNSSNGRITNRSPRYTDKEMFWVAMDRKPETKLYFRGFVGDTYENGKWSATDEEEFFPMVDQTAFLPEDAGREILNLSYEFGNMWLGMQHEMVEMLYSDDCGDYAYLPYFSNLYGMELSGLMVDADAVIRRPEETSHLAFAMIQMNAKDLSGMGYQYTVQIPGMDQLVLQYSRQSRNHYTKVPEQGVDRLLSLADTWKRERYGVEPYDFNYAIPISKVVEELDTRTTYSLSPGRVPFGSDVIENFLFDSRKGFCVHYASAATLLLRRLGVPARYVSGYTVDPDQFKKNPDGSYMAAVLDRNGHAWVEVFMDHAGWIPIEVTAGTPGMGYGMDEDSRRNAEMMRKILGKDEEEREETLKERENVAQTEENSGTQKTSLQPQRGHGKENGGLWVLLTAAACVTGTAVFCAVKRGRNARRRMRRADTRTAVLELSFGIRRAFWRAGVISEKEMTDEEYIARAGEWLRRRGETGFSDFMECVKRAAFSEYVPSEEEVLEGRRLCRRIKERLKQGNEKKPKRNADI